MLVAAYGEFEERVQTVRDSHGTKTDMIRLAVSRHRAPFKISDIDRELPNVSRELIRKVLGDLREEGVLRLEGTGRGSGYVSLT